MVVKNSGIEGYTGKGRKNAAKQTKYFFYRVSTNCTFFAQGNLGFSVPFFEPFVLYLNRLQFKMASKFFYNLEHYYYLGKLFTTIKTVSAHLMTELDNLSMISQRMSLES